MKILIDTYDYFFYLIYSLSKEIYPKHLDPEFYAVHAMNIIIAFGTAPMAVFLFRKFEVDFESYLFYEVAFICAILYFINLRRYRKGRPEQLIKYYQGRNNTAYKIMIGFFAVGIVAIWIIL